MNTVELQIYAYREFDVLHTGSSLNTTTDLIRQQLQVEDYIGITFTHLVYTNTLTGINSSCGRIGTIREFTYARSGNRIPFFDTVLF
jgi:hypothetical protein